MAESEAERRARVAAWRAKQTPESLAAWKASRTPEQNAAFKARLEARKTAAMERRAGRAVSEVPAAKVNRRERVKREAAAMRSVRPQDVIPGSATGGVVARPPAHRRTDAEIAAWEQLATNCYD